MWKPLSEIGLRERSQYSDYPTIKYDPHRDFNGGDHHRMTMMKSVDVLFYPPPILVFFFLLTFYFLWQN